MRSTCSSCQSIRRLLLTAVCVLLMFTTPPTPAGPTNPCVQADDPACRGPLRILSESADLPKAEQGSYYEVGIEVQGGKPSYVFKLTDGKLPDGLKLFDSGRIAGRPATAGEFTFSVAVKDSSGVSRGVSQTFLLRVAESASAAKPAEAPALRIVADSVNLPPAQQGAEYSHVVMTRGGRSPPTFGLSSGVLPPGIKLSDDGRLTGKPTVPGQFEFVVKATDAAASAAPALQEFRLRVSSTTRPAPAPWTQPPPQEPWDTGTLMSTEAVSYALLEPALAGIAQLPPEGSDAAPAPAAAANADGGDDAQAAAAAAAEEAQPLALRRGEMLKPLMNVDYPNRQLFESALNAKLCAYARTSVKRELKNTKNDRLLAVIDTVPCSPAKPTKPVRTGPAADGPTAAAVADATLLMNDEASQLLPPDSRATLVDRARREHRFDPNHPIRWNGGSCGCVLADLSGQVIAFYPFWQAEPKLPPGAPPPDKDKPAPAPPPQAVDFSVLTRIAYFGASFDDDGNFGNVRHWDVNHADFVREAHQHRTKLDLVVHRNDWTRLLALDETTRSRSISHAVHGALELIDTPLTDLGSTLQRSLPGYHADPIMGDGITLYFTDYPVGDSEQAKRFAGYFSKFVLELASQMKRRPRPYSINIVLLDQHIGRAPFDFPSLLHLILETEEPKLEHGRIRDDGRPYASSNNVTLRFLVMLSEPTSSGKKELRRLVEDDPALLGNNRRVFLHKVVPVVSPGGVAPLQLVDDLAYFEDNFGGVGLWGVPDDGDKASHVTSLRVRSVMRTDDARDDARISYLVCNHLWLLRALGELLLVAVAVAMGLYFGLCSVRRLGRPYLAACVLVAGVWILVMLALALWDPQFSDVRRHETLFWSGFVAALCVSGVVWMVLAYRGRLEGNPP